MNQRQLANVLIKILGLSLCAQSVTHILSSAISLFSVLTTTLRTGYSGGLYTWLSPLLGVTTAIIGLLFIFMSKPIAEMLFKEE